MSLMLWYLQHFSWKPFVTALLMAFIGELLMHPHLNVYDWVIACLYAFIIASVALLPTWLCILIARKRGSLHFALIALVFLLTPVLSMVALMVSIQLPRNSWERTKDAPEKLVKFVDMQAFWFFGGAVYAEGASGKTYVYTCDQGCQWKETQPLQPAGEVDQRLALWCNQEEARRALKPFAFFVVLEIVSEKSCGPDYSISTHFALDQSGSVWVWQQWYSFMDFGVQFMGHLFGGLVVSIISSVFLTRKLRRFLQPS